MDRFFSDTVNLDSDQCSHLGYLFESISNSACNVASIGACGMVAVALSASSLSSSTICKLCPIGSYSLLVIQAPINI